MSILFTPINLGKVQIKNRFIHSATYEVMSLETGEVSDKFVKRYQNLAKGEVGLIIPGYMFVHPLGRSYKYQTGIHSDDMIPGLRKVVEAVHQEGGKMLKILICLLFTIQDMAPFTFFLTYFRYYVKNNHKFCDTRMALTLKESSN